MKTARFLLLSTVALLALAGRAPAAATPPDLLTYQGYLTDRSGAALGQDRVKNFDVIFRIFQADQGGAPLWAEQQTVTVDNGYFSVLLGEGSKPGNEPRPFLSELFAGDTASERYVEMTVKGIGPGTPATDVTILPRLRLMTSPYAFLARKAVEADHSQEADHAESAGLAQSAEHAESATSLATGGGQSIVTLSGTNVGINQASPAFALDVGGTVRAAAFVGDGSGLTNVALLTADQTFTGKALFTKQVGVGGWDIYGKSKLTVQADLNEDWFGQLVIQGTLNTNKQLVLGYDTTDDYGLIQSVIHKSRATPLALNPWGGNVGIGKVAPTSALDVNGTLKASGVDVNGTLTASRAVIGSGLAMISDSSETNPLRVVRGRIRLDGTIEVGAGAFTVSKAGTGQYDINLIRAFSSAPTVTANALATAESHGLSVTINEGKTGMGTISVTIARKIGQEPFVLVDRSFNFIAIGPN